MQKNKLIELVRRQATEQGIGIADDIKRVSQREIELAIDNLYGDLLFLLLKDSQSMDFFIKSYDSVDVQFNSTSKEYYVEFPIKICQLPQNAGVKLVRGVGSNRKFIPTTNEDVDLFVDSDVAKYYDKTLYVLDGVSRIKFINFDYAQQNIRKVQIKLIPSFVEYAWTEDVPIPSGRVSEFVSLVAKSLFSSKKFLDTSSDGVSN